VTDLFDHLWGPLRACLVAIAGLWLASAWIQGYFGPLAVGALVVFAIAIAVVLLGFGIEALGRRWLASRPVMAVHLMESWTIAPLAVAVTAIAVATVVAIRFAVPPAVPAAEKALNEEMLAAITTFLTAAFVAWSGEQEEAPVAARVKKAFDEHYKQSMGPAKQEGRIRYFEEGSRGDLLAHSDAVAGISGWGHVARLKRARGIAAEMAQGTSDPRSFTDAT
jgi:hypothetical protein